MISYRRAGDYGTKGYDKIDIIDQHPAVWVADQNRYSQTVTRVYSAIAIDPDDEQRVRDPGEPRGDF